MKFLMKLIICNGKPLVFKLQCDILSQKIIFSNLTPSRVNVKIFSVRAIRKELFL